VTKAPAGIHVDWNVPVKVRDGTTLRVNVFRPAGDAPVPVIMSAHPYGKDKIPARTKNGRGPNPQYRLFPQPHLIEISEWTSWESPDPAVWVPKGYAVINADLRGGGTSEGVDELLSDQEAEDYYDLIEWAGTQSWSTGRVGLDGVSYLAISQYKVAALRPPHLAAICPWEGFSDLYRDFARPGGVREDGFSIVWSKGASKAARIKTPIRKEIVSHTERDEWYQSVSPNLERIEVPVLACGSFSDHSLHTRGSFEVFRRAGSPRKWLYTHRDGKWCAYYSKEATETRARFFDYILKGLENGWDSQPAVRLAIQERGAEPAAVLGEDSWPPKNLNWQRLWLDAETGAMTEAGVPKQAALQSFGTRRGKAQFLWTVPEDIDIIGHMALRLHVEVRNGDDVFLFAGMRKIHAGVEVKFEGSYGFSGDMVSKGWQRAAHRALDERLSSPWQPVHRHLQAEPLRPGEIVPVDIALYPHATRFRKGDQLLLELRGRWHYPRNPLTGQFPAWYQRSPKATCVLHTGSTFDAYLLLGSRPVNCQLKTA
jgi:hypothetical protein